jgi:NADP-dependent 3-hydroxy acid dehydrogenase YdfG
LELARRGADLVVTDRRAEDLEEVADGIRGLGREVSVHGFDVADLDAWKALRDALGPRGAQVLVNNAGVALTGPFVECSVEDLHWQLDVNLRGVMYGCHVMLPVLLEQPRAHIVNLSSLFGLIAMPDNAAYCMSKHAVKALTECLMVELPDRVGLTSVHPGAVATRIVTSGRYRGGSMSSKGAAKGIANGLHPDEAGRLIVDAIEARRERLIVGNDAKLLASLRHLMPVRHRHLLRAYYRWQRQRRARRESTIG